MSHPPKQINTILLCSAWLLKLHSPSDQRPELCLLVCLLEYWMHVVRSTGRWDVISILDHLLWIVLQWIILVFFFLLAFILPRFHRYLRNTSFSVFGGSKYWTKSVLVPLLSCNAEKKCPLWIYRNIFLYICHLPWFKYLFPYYFEGLILLSNNHILKYQELKQN